MRGNVGPNGYVYVSLRADGRTLTRTLHRLVCAAFHGPPPFAGAMVRHLDGDRLHNAAANLAWGSTQENADDRVAHGRSTRGTSNGMSRLTMDQVGDIRVRLALGEPGARIARSHGVSQTTVSNIKLRRTYCSP